MINNFEIMRKRLEARGGIAQEDRMIKDKYKAFQKALLYSYQACDVSLVQKFDSCEQLEKWDNCYKALINPDKTKQDYDNKILSIDYNTNFCAGDIFNWKGTNTNWIIYLTAFNEDAYFRGEIRLCRYKIKFKNEKGEERQTWAAIRGPVETTIETIQKNMIRINRPNLSLNILIPKNEDTLFAFNRYSKFMFQGKAWRVQAPDSISMKNIIEIAAEEYYIDPDRDDVNEELIDGLVIEKVDPNVDSEIMIEGPTFIKPKIFEIYKAPEPNGTWSVLEKDYPVCIKRISDQQVYVTWQKTISGQFTLKWSKGDTSIEKVIVVESLF